MKKLGELLLERGWIERGELLRGLRQQQQVGGRLGTCLLDMGAVSEEELHHVLGIQHGIEPVSVEDIRRVPEDVLGLLPAKAAVRCQAVPVKAGASKVHVALVDPQDLGCQDELSFAIGRRLVLRAASEVRVLEALERYYGEEMPGRINKLVERLNRKRFLWRDGEGENGGAAAEPATTTDPPDPLELFPQGPRLSAPHLPAPPARPEAAGPAGPVATAPVPAPPPPEESTATTPAGATAEAGDSAGSSVEDSAEDGADSRPAAETAAPEDTEAPAETAAPEEEAVQRPNRLSAVTLSEHERATLYGGRAPAPVSYEEAEDRLAKLESRDAVGSLVVDFLRQEFDRVILLVVRSAEVTGWAADGEALDDASVGEFSIPLSQPSIFLNLRQGSAFHLGPLPPLPAHRPLVAALGGESPDECLVLPVTLGERMLVAIYCDRNGHPLGGIDLEALRSLADAVARALERCILLKRQAQT